jgi:hypothetical protein
MGQSYGEVKVVLAGGAVDREALELGVALAEKNHTRLQLLLPISPIKTAFLVAAYLRAGVLPEGVEVGQEASLRRARESVPASVPVTTRVLTCGFLSAVRRLSADADRSAVVISTRRYSFLARALLRVRRVDDGRLNVLGDRRRVTKTESEAPAPLPALH